MRQFRRRVEENAVPIDMTPMIDCVFLLLVFFILTSRFVPDELQLDGLMPTTIGQTTDGPPAPPRERIRIVITPAGAPSGASERELDDWLEHARRQGGFPAAELRVGGGDPIRIDLAKLALARGPALDDQLARVHRLVDGHLARLDQIGGAPPIDIHCFSGLPWSFAILAYDAVRAHEATRATAGAAVEVREVAFAPPRLRGLGGSEDGRELAEIGRLR